MKKSFTLFILSLLFTLNCFSEIPESKFKNKSLLAVQNHAYDFTPKNYGIIPLHTLNKEKKAQ